VGPKALGLNNYRINIEKMKKKYLTPDVRVAYVGFEVNFLVSDITTGGSTGEDLDDPDYNDPWS